MSAPPDASKQWPENRDKGIDEINHLMKCFDEWTFALLV